MKITDLSLNLPCTEEIALTQYFPDETSEKSVKSVVIENLLDVYINEQLCLKMVCSFTDLPALVLGHLFSEGMIESADEVEQIYVCETGARAKVFLSHPFTAPDKAIEIRACDCGANGVLGRNLIEQGTADGGTVCCNPPKAWKIEWAFALAEEFAKGSPLHTLTHGTHSAYLSCNGKLLYSCEDLGRHNALDKVIGRALLDGVILSECMIFTSGRVPIDMIQKAARSGIAALVSNAVPTDKAIALAHRYGIALITTARRDKMDLF